MPNIPFSMTIKQERAKTTYIGDFRNKSLQCVTITKPRISFDNRILSKELGKVTLACEGKCTSCS
jgi:hypothetical protein